MLHYGLHAFLGSFLTFKCLLSFGCWKVDHDAVYNEMWLIIRQLICFPIVSIFSKAEATENIDLKQNPLFVKEPVGK